MTEKIVCLMIVTMCIILTVLFIRIIQAVFNKDKRKNAPGLLLLFAGIIVPVIMFYLPFQVSLQGYKQVDLRMSVDGQTYVIDEPEQLQEFSSILEKQKFIRSIDKTLFGTKIVSSDQMIDLYVIGNNGNRPTINFDIRCRWDVSKYSYLTKDFYICSIQNSGPFVQEMREFVGKCN